ncbi:hypothetical protein BC826DRAFT_1189824 [Russula brevipes]|nr:hypothetical protein BC826DRAFT_1189824 [Russula brevipes]
MHSAENLNSEHVLDDLLHFAVNIEAHQGHLVVSGDHAITVQMPSPPGPSTARELVMVAHSEAVDDVRDSDGTEDAALDDYEAARTLSLEKVLMSLMFFELDA